jgi:hypothetical protein
VSGPRKKRSGLAANRGLVAAAIIFLAALAAYGVSGFGSTGSGGGTPSPAASPLFPLRTGQVSGFQVKYQDSILTVARDQKTPTVWVYSVCPKASPGCPTQTADSVQTVALLTQILALAPATTLYGAPAGMTAYGLDTPTTGELLVRNTSNKTVDLWIGGKDPNSVAYYMRRVNTTTVWSVTAASVDQILGAVAAPPKPLPSPSLVPLPSPSPSAAAQPGAPAPSPS